MMQQIKLNQMIKSEPIILIGTVQHYKWGRQAPCLVQELAGANAGPPPYAELWVGSHPKGPAQAISSTPPGNLDQLIKQNPAVILGNESLHRYGPTLPFLFKILSIDEPLSIQAHPDLALAKTLHQRDSTNYPDANHKPEMAIALSEVQLLCGIRPISDLISNITKTPELNELLSHQSRSQLSDKGTTPRSLAHSLFKDLLSAESHIIYGTSNRLFSRLEGASNLSEEDATVLKLKQYYPQGDVGLFFIYVLNLIKLKPLQAVFLDANIPHAYLSGELAECMACSDNVVRVGLTPKFKDVSTLLEMVERMPVAALCQNYPVISVENIAKQDGSARELEVLTYPAFTPEFQVVMFKAHRADQLFKSTNGPGLFFVLDGRVTIITSSENTILNKGQAALIPANSGDFSISIEAGELFWITLTAKK